MSDYDRIAGAIQFLESHRAEQPSLATLAAFLGLSPSHFHRLFAAWAGATPKDFLQCLTLSHARELLHQGNNVLNTALAAGLSGPSRLHDLCVSLEAATPGEIKARGAGLTLHVGIADSPFGPCLLAESPRGLCHLGFFDHGSLDEAIAEMRAAWPLAEILWDHPRAASLAAAMFISLPEGKSPAPWKLFVRGTPFQLRVWRALLQVPSGLLVSYGNLAAAAGHPLASRATGSAVASNPISFLIPCHRVIRQTGLCGHYRWGNVRKRAILAWETSRTIATCPPKTAQV